MYLCKRQLCILATTDDNKGVCNIGYVIFAIYEIGYPNASGSDDGFTVFVDGNVGYLGQGRYVHFLQPYQVLTGSRSPDWVQRFSSIAFQMGGKCKSDLRYKNGYLYAVLNWDW